ncbi:MAG: hypothetical protein IPP17_30255 [Bacteroidetes bacterium]|nr:hypothetical protein [Bacteroidota bacterium]
MSSLLLPELELLPAHLRFGIIPLLELLVQPDPRNIEDAEWKWSSRIGGLITCFT